MPQSNTSLQEQDRKQGIHRAPYSNIKQEGLVRKHPAPRGSVGHGACGEGRTEHRTVFAESAGPSWAVLHLRRVLAEGEGLGAVELGTLLDLAESTLAGEFMLLIVHLNVVLRVTHGTVLGKERAVATIENVHIRVGKVWVSVDVDSPVLVTDVLGHDRRAVGRVLAVQDQSGARLRLAEQFVGKFFLVIVVERAIDVAAFILVLETAVDDHDVVEAVIELPTKKLEQSALVDARQSVRLILGGEVRKLQGRRTFDVTDGLEGCICRYLGLFFGNHICRVLKHTQ